MILINFITHVLLRGTCSMKLMQVFASERLFTFSAILTTVCSSYN